MQDVEGEPVGPVQRAVDAACGGAPAVRWSVCVRAPGVVAPLAVHDSDRVLSTASIGKLLLLVAVADDLERGVLDPDERLARHGGVLVGDSGLWQHLRVDELVVEDLAVLVGAVSDNLATNVLLERVGLDRVQRTARELGLTSTALLDRVRDTRTPADPPQLSVGTGAELAQLLADVGAGTLVSPGVSRRLGRWLAAGTDLSMVAAAFGLDPLAHVDADRGVVLVGKTGTDVGVRADVGHVRGPAGALAYAVVANWDDDAGDRRDEVLAAMTGIGRALAAHVGREAAAGGGAGLPTGARC